MVEINLRYVCRVKIRTPIITTGKNYNRKNKVQLSGRWLEHETRNTTHTDTTTNKMSRATLYPPATLPPLSPWVEQWRHQIMVPPLPKAMRRPQPIRVALAVVGLLAWGGEIRGIE